MIIDLILIGLYAIAVRFTMRALVPAIAFVSTIAFSFIDMSQAAMHVGYAAIYLSLIPLSNTKVCMAMLLYPIVNTVSAGYFLSSFYLESFPVYFAVSMIVINLVILLTTSKGLKNGKYTDEDRIVQRRA
jgi:hypothetical protein